MNLLGTWMFTCSLMCHYLACVVVFDYQAGMIMLLLPLYWRWVWVFPLCETPEWLHGLEKRHPRHGGAVHSWRLDFWRTFPLTALHDTSVTLPLCIFWTLNICIRCGDWKSPRLKPVTRSITHFGLSARNSDIWLTFHTSLCLLSPVKVQIPPQPSMFHSVYTLSPLAGAHKPIVMFEACSKVLVSVARPTLCADRESEPLLEPLHSFTPLFNPGPIYIICSVCVCVYVCRM